MRVLNGMNQQRGVPKALFCDNGNEFTSHGHRAAVEARWRAASGENDPSDSDRRTANHQELPRRLGLWHFLPLCQHQRSTERLNHPNQTTTCEEALASQQQPLEPLRRRSQESPPLSFSELLSMGGTILRPVYPAHSKRQGHDRHISLRERGNKSGNNNLSHLLSC